jgi:AraC-like DNA-binding protein
MKTSSSVIYHLRLCLLLWLVVFSVACAAGSTPSADSIRHRLPHLKGPQRLEALSRLVVIAIDNDDSRQPIYIRQLIDEAHRQGSVEREAYGRKRLLCYYYNYDKRQPLMTEMPQHLKFMAANKQWGYYYDSWSLLVENYFYEEHIVKALSEARDIYVDAKKRANSYGMAMAFNLLGEIYTGMNADATAISNFKRALAYAAQAEDADRLLLTIYSNYSDALFNVRHYASLFQISTDWKKRLDIYAREQKDQGFTTAALGSQYAYCYLAMADAKMEMGRLQEAGGYLNLLGRRIAKETPRVRSAYYHDRARLAELQRNYPLALDYSRQCLAVSETIDDSVGIFNLRQQYAELLVANGRDAEGARLLSQLLVRRDSMDSYTTRQQLNEMSTLFQLEDLQASRSRSRSRLLVALMVMSVLLSVIIAYIIYARKLKKKERMMFKTIHRFMLTDSLSYTYLSTQPAEKLTAEQQLYVELCDLMEKKKPFRDPNLNRDTLARRLGTNRTYLGEAIRKCVDGLTVSDFITRYRLHYAASLLLNCPDMPINTVGDEAGFNSRSTYNRLFREFFGVSPTDFREGAKEDKTTIKTAP